MELAAAILMLVGVDTRVPGGLEEEAGLITTIARDYELDEEGTRLLVALRACENGGAGLEFGVGSGDPDHQARRFAYDPRASLVVQCRWAAGTIKKRYRGDLEKFMARWNPADPHEVENVRSRLGKKG